MSVLSDRIHEWCDFWERCKVHPKKMNVQGHKRFLSSLLYERIVEKNTFRSIGFTHLISPERVRQIAASFKMWHDKKYGVNDLLGEKDPK